MNAWTPPAGWWPLVGLLIVSGLIVLAVEHWDRRSSMDRYIDRRAKADRLLDRDLRRGR